MNRIDLIKSKDEKSRFNDTKRITKRLNTNNLSMMVNDKDQDQYLQDKILMFKTSIDNKK